MFAKLRGRVNDGMNPIVVKELRQSVKSRFVDFTFLLFLIVQLLVMGFSLMFASEEYGGERNFQAGRRMFVILQGILLGTSMLFVPLYTGLRFAAERSDVNVDLLFITTLKPRAIVWGKMVSAVILTLLIFSACAPFMIFTYLLRGIDATMIVLVLAIDFAAVLIGTQVAVFLAVLPSSRVFRVLLGAFGAFTLVSLFSYTMAGTVALVDFGPRFGGLWTRDFWGIFGGFAELLLATMGLFFCVSVAALSPPSANRALPVRVCLFVIWTTTLFAAVVWCYFEGEGFPLNIWMSFSAAILALTMFVNVSERERLGPRVTRTIPRSFILRPFAFLFYSGAAGGMVLSTLMMLVTYAVAVAFKHEMLMVVAFGQDFDWSLYATAIIGFYALAYALTAVLVRRLIFRDRVQVQYTGVIAAVLVGALSVFPLLAPLFFRSRGYWDEGSVIWTLPNPFAALSAHNQYSYGVRRIPEYYMLFAGSWAALATVLCIPWFRAQIGRFRPLVRDP